MNQTTIAQKLTCGGLPRFERRDLKWLVIYFAFYMFTYASYIFAGVVRIEDVLEGPVGPEFLLNGRFMVWVMRFLTGGEAVNYPMSGIFSGVLLSVGVLLLVKWLRVHDDLQRALCGMAYCCMPQWLGTLYYQKMADAVALGILLCLLAAILISSPGKRYMVLSVLCCTLGISCYQTLALVFGVAVLTALLYAQRYEVPNFCCRYLLKAAVVAAVSCVLYFCISTAIKSMLPEDLVRGTAGYQNTVCYWGKCGDIKQACGMIWEYGIRYPLHAMVRDFGKTYLVAFAAMAVFLWRAYAFCGIRRMAVLTVLSGAVLALPFATGILLLSPSGITSRVLCAAPLAILCSVALMVKEGVLSVPKLRMMMTALFVLLFVENAYRVSAFARDESYAIQTAIAELRDMSMMGRMESRGTSAQDGRIVLCGYLPADYETDPRVADAHFSYGHSHCASPYLFREKRRRVRAFGVDAYAQGERLPRLSLATAEEEALHAETLRSMPIWPADGSVKVDGNVVLIKIWDLLDTEEP